MVKLQALVTDDLEGRHLRYTQTAITQLWLRTITSGGGLVHRGLEHNKRFPRKIPGDGLICEATLGRSSLCLSTNQVGSAVICLFGSRLVPTGSHAPRDVLCEIKQSITESVS